MSAEDIEAYSVEKENAAKLTEATCKEAELARAVADAKATAEDAKANNADKTTLQELWADHRRLDKEWKDSRKVVEDCERAGLPFWIVKCRGSFPTDKMQKGINDDGATWDAYSLGTILHVHMREFATHLKLGERQAKRVVSDLLQTLARRNGRAHNHTPSESESLETLRLVCDLLKAFQCNEKAVKDAGVMLSRAQSMLAQARAKSESEHVDLSKLQYTKLLFLCALRQFMTRLAKCCGVADFANGTMVFGNDKDPNDPFRFGETFKLRRDWVKEPKAKTMFTDISDARNNLFHDKDANIALLLLFFVSCGLWLFSYLVSLRGFEFVWSFSVAVCCRSEPY